ncbi:uncharacterized protein AAGF69_006893 isoform 2-T2 [Amazona ochrocephala]
MGLNISRRPILASHCCYIWPADRINPAKEKMTPVAAFTTALEGRFIIHLISADMNSRLQATSSQTTMPHPDHLCSSMSAAVTLGSFSRVLLYYSKDPSWLS